MIRRTRRPVSEVDLARPVIVLLEEHGYSVSQEVQVGKRRADLVAIQGEKVMVVETKLHLSWELLLQGLHWKRYAHLVMVATCFADSEERSAARKALMCFGIGLVEVAGQRAVITVDPIPNGRADTYEITSVLRPEHKTSARAGTNAGGYHTPFKGTSNALVAYVREHPGEALRDIVGAIPHHYASKLEAIKRLEKMIQHEVIKGIRIERRGGRAYLYPAEQEAVA
jgi:hypothetical protein